jgi:hypothetical protein
MPSGPLKSSDIAQRAQASAKDDVINPIGRKREREREDRAGLRFLEARHPRMSKDEFKIPMAVAPKAKKKEETTTEAPN